MLLIRFVLYVSIITIGFSAYSYVEPNNKPVAKFVAVENPGFTNKDGTGLYWDIIDTLFSEHYQVIKKTASLNKARNMVSGDLAFAIVGQHRTEQSDFLLSEQHIARTYPIYAIYKDRNIILNGLESLKGYDVAVQKNAALKHLLPQSVHQYNIESIFRADKLIINNKVDIGLVYSYDLHLASPQNLLIHQEILPAQNVYLAFSNDAKGKRWQKIFDQKMAQAIKDNKLKSLYDNELEFRHANYVLSEKKNNINWNLTPKLYNHKTHRLEVLKRELMFSKYIAQQLPEFYFNFTELSDRVVNQKIANEVTHCSLSIDKNINKVNKLSSEPVHTFIKPRLFFLRTNDNDSFTTHLSTFDEVDITALLNNFDELSIAISINSRIYKDLTSFLSKDDMHKFYLVDDLNYKSLVDLLMAKRIDAIIIWPSMVAELLNNKQSLELLDSKLIKQAIGNNLFSVVTCSNSDEGQKIINKINDLLHSPVHQYFLHQGSLEQLDPASKIEYQKLLELPIE